MNPYLHPRKLDIWKLNHDPRHIQISNVVHAINDKESVGPCGVNVSAHIRLSSQVNREVEGLSSGRLRRQPAAFEGKGIVSPENMRLGLHTLQNRGIYCVVL